jgi:hypothetical protein
MIRKTVRGQDARTTRVSDQGCFHISNKNTIVYDLFNSSEKYLTFRYWCGDESRFGCQTIEGRKLTMKGVKPHDDKQWKLDYYYLYGLVEPKS